MLKIALGVNWAIRVSAMRAGMEARVNNVSGRTARCAMGVPLPALSVKTPFNSLMMECVVSTILYTCSHAVYSYNNVMLTVLESLQLCM